MKKKKQTYSKVIPALALIGGAYLLLTYKSGTPPIIDEGPNTGTGNNTPANTGNTGTSLTAFNAVPVNANVTTFQSNKSESQVAGTDVVKVESSSMPDFNKWKGYDWYSYVNMLSGKMPKALAIKQAFKEWDSPENKYYSMMPNEASFLLGLAMAEKMPFYNKKDFVESGDYGNDTGNDKIGYLVPVDRPILWNSQPVYDTYYGWWYDVEAWSCQDWVDWHKALERKYNSTRKANDIWRSAWFNSQNSGANAALENNWYYCPRDCANFVRYFATKGITDTGGGFTAPVYCSLTGIVQNIVGTVESGTDAIVNTSKVLKIAIPVAVIALGYYAYKNLLPALQKKYIK